jgi:DNA-binding HxlR family transcriptional regulator
MAQDDPFIEEEAAAPAAYSVPVARIVEEVVGCKWSVSLLQACADGHRRPSALLRACPGLSAKVMNERLRKMIRFGILKRTVFGEKPPIEVEYWLTPFGRRFMDIVAEVRRLEEEVRAGTLVHGHDRPPRRIVPIR